MKRDGFACDVCGSDAPYIVKLQNRTGTRGAPKAGQSFDLCEQHRGEIFSHVSNLIDNSR